MKINGKETDKETGLALMVVNAAIALDFLALGNPEAAEPFRSDLEQFIDFLGDYSFESGQCPDSISPSLYLRLGDAIKEYSNKADSRKVQTIGLEMMRLHSEWSDYQNLPTEKLEGLRGFCLSVSKHFAAYENQRRRIPYF